MEDDKLEKADNEFHGLTLVQCASGKSKAKRKTPHQAFLFPHKPLLNPTPFKKRTRKRKRKRKLVRCNCSNSFVLF